MHYKTPQQAALDVVDVTQMERYVSEGHFKAGSMGPKVEACLRVARAGGVGIVASLTDVLEAMEGTAGTRVVAPKKGIAPKAGPEHPQGRHTSAGTNGKHAHRQHIRLSEEDP